MNGSIHTDASPRTLLKELQDTFAPLRECKLLAIGIDKSEVYDK